MRKGVSRLGPDAARVVNADAVGPEALGPGATPGQRTVVADVKGRQPAGEGLGDDECRSIGSHDHAVRELDVTCDLASRSVWGYQADPPWCGFPTTGEVEVGAVHIDVADRVDNDLVATLLAVPLWLHRPDR